MMKSILAIAAFLTLPFTPAFLSSCAAPRFRAAIPEHANRMECCIGTVRSIDRTTDNEPRIVLEPDPSGRYLLAPGQQFLPCEQFAQPESVFANLMATLEIGSRVEICGFLVADDQEGGIHKIRTISSIDPYLD